MAHTRETDKERLARAVESIQDARPPTDKKVFRAKADRKPYVKRNPDGEFNVGGWRGSPKSLAALEAHRGRTQFGTGAPRCHCGQPAVRGSDECRFHGGKRTLAARRAKDHVWKPKRSTVRVKELKRLLREGRVHADLMKVHVFRAVLNEVVGPVPSDIERGSKEWRERGKFWEACAILSLQFIIAWQAMTEDDEHGPWHEAVAVARQLGFV